VPEDGIHLMTGVMEMPIALLDGRKRVGATGIGPAVRVVNIQALDQTLTPALFFALTLQ
jgi:hypothetical protein